MGSLQDALLKSGLVDEKKLEHKKKPGRPKAPRSTRSRPDASGQKGPGSGNGAGTGKGRPPGTAGDTRSDLARAYAARKRAEAAEKERDKQARLADQEARRQRNLKLDALVEGQALNREDAEVPRYFEHIGRIRRVLCTAEQRQALNEGNLGVVSLRGRYLIVPPEVLQAYRELAPDLVPDLSGREPEAEEGGDYPPVPDDLAW